MTAYSIEFVGGPFDGYREHVSIPPRDLAPHVAIPVSRSVFRLLDGQLPAKKAPLTSIAFYRQETEEGHTCYRFVASRSWLRMHIEG